MSAALVEILAYLAPGLKWVAISLASASTAIWLYLKHIAAVKEAERAKDESNRKSQQIIDQRVINETQQAENERFKATNRTRDQILDRIDFDKLTPDQRKLLFTNPNLFLDQHPDIRQFEKTDPGSAD